MSDDEFLNELAAIDVNEDEIDDWTDDDVLEATPPKHEAEKMSTDPPVTVAAPPPKPSPPVTAPPLPSPKQKPKESKHPKSNIPAYTSNTFITNPSASVVKPPTTTTTTERPHQGKRKKPTAEATTTKPEPQEETETNPIKQAPPPTKQQQVKKPLATTSTATTAPPPSPPPSSNSQKPDKPAFSPTSAPRPIHPKKQLAKEKKEAPPPPPPAAAATILPPPQPSHPPPKQQEEEAKKSSPKPTTDTLTNTMPPKLPTLIQEGKYNNKESEQAVETALPTQSDGTSGGGGGWGFLGKITSVAAIAVKDITDLGQSFSEVLVEAAKAAEADDEGERGEEGEQQQVSSSSSITTEEGDDVAKPPQEQRTDTKKQQPVAQSDINIATTTGNTDDDIENGNDDDDDDDDGPHLPELLSSGASAGGKALTSIWGWVSSTATTMAQELTDTAMDAGPALQAVKSNVGSQASRTRPEFKLGQTLTDVAKGASSFIQSGLAPMDDGDDDTVGVDGTTTDNNNSNDKKSQSAMTFSELYQLFGGEEAEQDLEGLSSECSRLCNKYRASIRNDKSASTAFEALLSSLQPIYDLEASSGAEVVSSSQPSAIQLEKGHQIITNMVSSAIDRANSIRKEMQEKRKQEDNSKDNNDDGKKEQDGKHKKMVEMEGRKRLAEVAAVCTERLLALGRSVHMIKKTGRPSDDGIAWPRDDAVSTSLLLRGQAEVMVGDVKAVHTAFTAALEDGDGGDEKEDSGLLADIEAASRRIEDCYRLLLFVGLQCGVMVEKMAGGEG